MRKIRIEALAAALMHHGLCCMMIALALAAMTTACDDDDKESDVHRLAVTVFKPDEKSLLPWQADDAILLASDEWADVDVLPLVGAKGGMSGQFYSSQGRRMEPGVSYAVFAPATGEVTGHTVGISLEGQCQDRYGRMEHLAAYDYRASNLIPADADGLLAVEARRLVACVTLRLAMPAADRLTSLRLSSRGRKFVTHATYDLLAPSAGFCATDSAEALVLGITDMTTIAQDDTLELCLMVAPDDFRMSEWNVELVGEHNVYVRHLLGMNLRQGGVYTYEAELKAPEAVDLGIVVEGKRVLWADMNVGATEPGEPGDYLPLTATDMAHRRWGSGWHTPTMAELDALMACEMRWDGIRRGYLCVGPNGNSVFLPLAGSRMNGVVSDLYLAGFIAPLQPDGAASSPTAYYLVPRMLPSSMAVANALEVSCRAVRREP